jgi:hypothetical protein
MTFATRWDHGKGELMRAVAAAILLAAGAGGLARAETCMKSGEESGGLGTTCYYSCSFGQKAVNLGPAQICPMTTQADASRMMNHPPSQAGGSCFKQGERETGGMTKECIYDCTGTRKVMTIASSQICPVTTR